MQEHSSPQPPTDRSPRSFPLGAIAIFSTAVVVVGGGLAWFTLYSLNSSVTSPPPPANTSVQPNQISEVPIEQSVQIYWLKSSGSTIEVAPSAVSIKAAGQPNDILKAAFEQLLQGSKDTTLTSTIPHGTTLRSLDVKADGVHVDLSSEFTSGGGSTSMIGRVAQVIYTATTLDASAPVWISVNGKPLDVMGGEGLMLDQPMTRDRFKQEFKL